MEMILTLAVCVCQALVVWVFLSLLYKILNRVNELSAFFIEKSKLDNELNFELISAMERLGRQRSAESQAQKCTACYKQSKGKTS